MKSRYVWLAIAVVILAIITRLYALGDVPGGMAWDEAAIGYNGWSIWHTYRDEWLIKMPVSFKSFGDFKAPLAIYANGLFTTILGLDLWAVRLPFAIFGVISIVAFMLLTAIIWPNKARNQHWLYGIGAGLLLTTSPWHHHFSRIGFESGMSLGLLIWGFLSLEWAKTNAKSKLSFWLKCFGLMLLAMTLYTYHSNKLVTPLLLLYWLWLNRVEVKTKLWQYLTGLGAMVAILLPFLKDSLLGEGLTRAGVNILSTLPFPYSIWVFITNFFSHLTPNFLIFGEVTTLRHGDGNWGVLLPTVFVLVLVRFVVEIFHLITANNNIKKVRNIRNWRYFSNLAFGWLVIGLLPAALGADVPHSNRALQALPGFLLLALLGLQFVINYFYRVNTKLLITIILTVHLLLFGLYINNYYTNFAKASGADFQAGYEEAILSAELYLHGSEEVWPVERVIFTSDYEQTYIYALFFKQVTPYQYHNGVLSLYEFKDDVNVGDLSRNNTLVVASSSDDTPHQSAIEKILGTDGEVRFYIYKTADRNAQ